MSYHSHKLSPIHSHIIGRTDPITSDTIKENDKVVFCLNCHSCFLEESWNYMNNRHCEQNQTLKFIPFPPPQLIAKKKAQKLIAELKDSIINPLPIFILTILFGFIGYYLAEPEKFGFIIMGIILGILIGTLLQTTKIKKVLRLGGEEVRIYESYIETENVKFFWNEIEQIHFRRTMYVVINTKNMEEKGYSHTPKLGIRLKNGRYTEIELATKNYPSIKSFLFGLAWASQFVNISFYTEHEKEYGLIKSFDRNYQGNIEIGEPTQLVYNPEEN